MITTVREARDASGEASPSWGLCVVHHPDDAVLGRRVLLARGGALDLGRDAVLFGGAALSDPRVSRAHARVRVDADGERCFLEDLGSSNGTRVNGVAAKARELAPGDVVGLGPFLLSVVRAPAQRFAESDREGGSVPLKSAAMAGLWRAGVAALGADVSLLLHGEHGAGLRALGEAIDARAGGAGFCVVGPSDSQPIERAIEGAGARRLYCDELGAWEPARANALAAALQSGRARAVLAWHEPRADAPALLDFVQRSGVLALRVPPLRERVEDVPWLVRAALRARLGGSVSLHVDLAAALLRAPWPGNLASLESFAGVLARSAAGARGELAWRDEYAPLLGVEAPRALPAGEAPHGRAAAGSVALSPDAGVRVARDGSWIDAPVSQRVSLEDRHALRRVLGALAEGHQSAPGATVTVEQIVARGWPGAKLGHEVALNRVYAAIAALRRLGLRDVLQRTEEGYRFDPRVGVRVDEP